MKGNEKNSFINYIIQQIDHIQHESSFTILDTYYKSRKSFEDPNTFEILFNYGTKIAALIPVIISLIKEFKKKYQNSPRIFIKRQDGLYVELKEGMTEEDVLKQFEKNSKPNYKKGTVIDVYISNKSKDNIQQIKKSSGIFIFAPFLFTSNSEGIVECIIQIYYETKIFDLLKSGFLGISPEFYIRRFLCNICKKDYEFCEHNIEELYDGKQCHTELDDYNAENIALVSKPEDARADIKDILVIETKEKIKNYAWHALKQENKKNRLKRINRVLSIGLIEESPANHFLEFYKNNSEGISNYKTKE